MRQQIPTQSILMDNYEVVSLMLRYLNGELSSEATKKVKEHIENCAKCSKLFNEVKFFFSDTGAFLHEIQHQEKIESSRRRFRNFTETYYEPVPPPTMVNELNGCEDFSPSDECFCS
jgi:hypothetical protein